MAGESWAANKPVATIFGVYGSIGSALGRILAADGGLAALKVCSYRS